MKDESFGNKEVKVENDHTSTSMALAIPEEEK